jgi:hypothetical protein
VALHVSASRPLAPAPASLAIARATRTAPEPSAPTAAPARPRERDTSPSPTLHRAPARFVDVSSRRLLETTLDRRATRLWEVACTRTGRPSAAARAAALPAAFRRRAARHERLALAPARLVPPRPPVTASPRPEAASAAAVTAERAAASASPARPAAAASAVDVDALTSHVIQQLDRRLVAYRERMGRV